MYGFNPLLIGKSFRTGVELELELLTEGGFQSPTDREVLSDESDHRPGAGDAVYLSFQSPTDREVLSDQAAGRARALAAIVSIPY